MGGRVLKSKNSAKKIERVETAKKLFAHLKGKVIIIGAGAAGIAAATRLYTRGVKNLIVLEAQNRIGGRINSVDLDEYGLVELGAQWVHGEEKNVVYELASPRNLLTHSDNFKNSKFINSSSCMLDDGITQKFQFVFSKMREDKARVCDFNNKISLGQYLFQKLEKEFSDFQDITEELKEQFMEWFHQFNNSIDGCDSSFDVSSTTLSEYWECEGDSLLTWKEGGYINILNILLESISDLNDGKFENINIKLNHKVSSIDIDGDQVIVFCENGTKFVADHIILTVSLGVLKESYQTLFKFPLPENNMRAIDGLSIGTVDKMFLIFPFRWWPDNVSIFNLLWTKEDKETYINQNKGWLTDVFAFHEVDSSPLALCGWVVGESARTMELKSDDEVKTSLIELLQKFVGSYYDIPEPKLFIRSCWHDNSYIRGSYSFRSKVTDEMNTSSSDLALPIKNGKGIPVIHFAGEATHDHYYSTVHGAIETGWREADLILKIMNIK